MEKITVVVADDHQLFRQGVVVALKPFSHIEVVGEAQDGEEAIHLVRTLRPRVVLMDVKMPNINGIEATRVILEEFPNIRVVMLTMYEDDNTIFDALRVGARGYLLKGIGQADLCNCIETVSSGNGLFCQVVVDNITRRFSNIDYNSASSSFQLTSRELEVLTLVAEGMKNKEIAKKLMVSPKTVNNHLTNIFGKFQVNNRVQAIQVGRQLGII